MFNVEPSYTVIPIVVEDREIFWNMTSHLGVGVKTWASYAEFEITRENLEIVLSYFEKRDWPWLAEAQLLLTNTDADRYQFLHYEEGTLDTLEEVVF